MQQVIYRQLNKDYAYWTEKRRIGQMKGGQLSGLLSTIEDGEVQHNILFDVGMGTLEAIADFCPDEFWDQPLTIFITHGHIDHHAELMILSEIYCQRRGETPYDFRPPLHVYCTADTQKHLYNTHLYGYTGGGTLKHELITPLEPLQKELFRITPIAVDHFEGAVIYVIEFELNKPHKILIGWDMTTLPLEAEHIERLQNPSLALIEATTWKQLGMGHTCVMELAETGFLHRLQLTYTPDQERYGSYIVHYSGLEDVWGMLTDDELKTRFDATYPDLASLVRMAKRGQAWSFGSDEDLLQ